MGRPAVDMRGEKYGSLEVVERCGSGTGVARWKCMCVCGDFVIVRRDHLLSGNTKSCGQCGVSTPHELTSATAKYLLYGHSGTPFVWKNKRVGFGIALVGATREYAHAPVQLLAMVSPELSAMKRLVEAGLIRGREGRTDARWMKDEKCVPMGVTWYGTQKELEAVHESIRVATQQLGLEQAMTALIKAQDERGASHG